MQLLFTSVLCAASWWSIANAYGAFEPGQLFPHVTNKNIIVEKPLHHQVYPREHFPIKISKSGLSGVISNTILTSNKVVAHAHVKDAIESPYIDTLVLEKHPHHYLHHHQDANDYVVAKTYPYYEPVQRYPAVFVKNENRLPGVALKKSDRVFLEGEDQKVAGNANTIVKEIGCGCVHH